MTFISLDKKIIILVFLLFVTLNSYSQYDYDLIKKKDIFIIKTDSIVNGKLRIPISEIKSINDAEKLFGKNHSSSKQHSESFGDNFTKLTFRDGLDLDFSDTFKTLFTFHVKSIAYTLYFANGTQIKVGMTADLLAKIFPKSYLTRRMEKETSPYEGKSIFSVYFSNEKNPNEIGLGSALVFILSSKDNTLYEFLSYSPD
jgi:hypothetical protein